MDESLRLPCSDKKATLPPAGTGTVQDTYLDSVVDTILARKKLR
jgi:hypothetical protein